MSAEDIGRLVVAKPFTPFLIILKDGSFESVPYPRTIVLTPEYFNCYTPKSPGSWIMTKSVRHTYDEIARIEMLPQQAKIPA